MSNLLNLIQERNISEIKKMIENKEADPNEIVSINRTALSFAAANNFIDILECLISVGANINKQNTDKLAYTPLEEASRGGHLEAVKYLIEKGADINKGNSINNTSLTGAVICAERAIVEYLIINGANVNAVDDQNQSALHYLCKYGREWWTLAGALGVIRGEKNEDAQYNRFKKHDKIFNILLQNGADVNLETSYGFTPLMLAADSNAEMFIQPLIKKGAKINFQNTKGFSALHAACDKGNVDAAKILIKKGADINIVDSDGFTPLLGATISQNIKLTTLLVKLGADKSIKSKINYRTVSIGETALDVATKLKNSKLVNVLK